jgi:hypothetical protein
MKQEQYALKNMPYTMLVLTLTFLLVIPAHNTALAADPSQALPYIAN